MKSNSIVFFGTGNVSLDTLLGIYRYFNIEAVITKPDRTIHNRPISHPVKKWAKKQQIPTHQPANKDELNQLFAHTTFLSPVGLVVDYGLIIPQNVISSFTYGIVNSHFSLLPQWRGPDPITAALLSGQTKSGVSLMLIKPKLDEGPLLDQISCPIPPHATITELTKNLITLSNQRINLIFPKYLAGQIKPWAQTGKPSYSHKLTKADGRINWALPAVSIERQVRAYLGWPGSYTQLAGRDITITSSRVYDSIAKGAIGKAEIKDQKLLIQTGEGRLEIKKLRPAGKKEMTGAEFIRGYLQGRS